MANRRWKCSFPEWEESVRPCDNPNEGDVRCEDCPYAQEDESE